MAVSALATKTCKKLKTKDLKGKKNGFLLEIASSKDGWSKFLDKAQVYLTTVLPKMTKGWHLHHKKENQFTCIKGQVMMAVWNGKNVQEFRLGGNNPITVRVPKKQAVCFYNPGKEEAYILNLCSPPYDPSNPEQEDLDIPWEPRV